MRDTETARECSSVQAQDRCTVNLETQALLGRQEATSGFAMWYSRTLNLDSLSRNFNHEIRQQFAITIPHLKVISRAISLGI